MYVIFPADEVVYLSYGRLIYVPNHPNSDNKPLRTSVELSSTSATPSTTSNPKAKPTERAASTGCSSSSLNRPSTSQVKSSSEASPKKKPSRFNFSLIRRSNSKDSASRNVIETPFSPRVRHSICEYEKSDQLHPEEAFRRFCAPHPHTESNPEPLAVSSGSKKSSIRSTTSSKPSVQEEPGSDSKRSSKHSSSSSKSKTEKLSPSSSNNSSLKKSPKPPVKTLASNKPSEKKGKEVSEEPFYPLATSRERTYTDPCVQASTSGTSKEKSGTSKLLSTNSFRLPFRKSPQAEGLPVPPERKKNKKSTKEKPLERKLSFSDYLARSREKTDVSGVSKPSETSNKSSIKREKSPVLSFFRGKSASPRNLGRNRTLEVSFDKSLDSLRISTPENAPARASSEQRYRAPSEKSRPRQKRAHFINDRAREAKMAACESALKDLHHPAYNEYLKSHNAVAFKLVKTVSDFTQQLSQMYEHHAEEMQMLVANFRKRNGELRKERPACPSSLFHTWEALLQEVEIDSQALGDIASILGRQVSRPMLERSFYRKIQSRKVFTHRESYETILAKTEEKLAKCRQEYKNAYLSYLSNPTTDSLSAYFNTHNAYVQQLHATNGMMEEYGKETLPSILQELEEIYSDLCSTVTDAVIQGAEVVSARALEQSKRYDGLINQCRLVSGPADLNHLARSLPTPQGRGPIVKRIFVPPQPPPPEGLDGDATDGLINDSIPPPLKDELVIDQLSAVQIRPSHDALRKESDDLRIQIRQIQDALDTLLRVQQRSAEASLYNKANELQEDVSMKRFELRVAQIHLSAINAQKELFSSKLEGDTGSARERKMSAASTASMKNKWLKAFKSLKTPPPEVEKKNGAAATKELLKGDPDAHNFQEYTYKKITPCDVCSQILRGHTRQGLKCRICKMNVHVDCQDKASKCQTKARLLRRQKSTSEIETKVQNATPEEEKAPQISEVDQIYQVLKQATEISNIKPRVNVESALPGITVDRGSNPGGGGSSGSSGQSLNRRVPAPPQPPRAAGSTLAVINPAPCSTSSDRNCRHHSQGPLPSTPQQQQQPPPQDSSSMRRRLFAGMKSLTGFGSRSRHGSPGHRSISLPETPHSPRRQKLNLRMKSLSLDSPESTEHVQRRQRHAAATGGSGSNPHSDPHSAQGSTSRIQFCTTVPPRSLNHLKNELNSKSTPSSPVHNRRLLSAKNIRMSSVELPDDNEKSPSSASTSPCPSPVGKKTQRLLPTNLYVVLYNFKSRHQDELDLKAGYKVTVIDTSDPDWWKGKCLGRVGFFPSKYVSKLSSGEKPLQVTHNLQVSDGDNGLMLLRDQIVIQIGEEVDGMIMIRSGDNRQGVCPVKFLQEV